MARKQGIVLAIVAFVVYIIGGFACFGGIGLVVFMNGHNLWGWGDGRTIGYLFICVGAFLSVLGVLLIRIFRNQGLG
jgi:hypothetical protein